MTITSRGYPGTIVPGNMALTAVDYFWAHRSAGRRYWVGGSGDELRVYPLTTGDRRVRVSAGRAGGCGIQDELDIYETLELPASSSGTQWHLVGLLRDWALKRTTVASIPSGTSGNTITGSRPQSPGTGQDFQPLALVPVTAGQTIPGEPRDVRVIGLESVQHAYSDLVKQYADTVGTQLWINGSLWVRGINDSFSPTWTEHRYAMGREVELEPAPGFTLTSANAHRQGDKVTLRGRSSRNAGPLPQGARNDEKGYRAFRLPDGFRPGGDNRRFLVAGFVSGSTYAGAQIVIDADGWGYAKPFGPASTADIYLDDITFPASEA